MNATRENRAIACHHCDQISQVPELQENQVAICPLCDCLLVEKKHKEQHAYVLPMAISSLILLLLALPFNFISFSRQGLVQSIQLLDTADILLDYSQPALAILINLVIILLPAGILLIILSQQFNLIYYLPTRIHSTLTKTLFIARDWSMPEIFLAAVLVSLVKIVSLAEVGIGLSFWSYAGFVLCFFITLINLDKSAIWDQVIHHSEFSQHQLSQRAIDLNLAVCPHCSLLSSEKNCPRCHTALMIRDPFNLQKTLALTITAILLYIPANLYPIMTTVFLADSDPSTIIGGVVLLWHHGSYPIAVIIFIASVMLPLAKLSVLLVLTWVVKNESRFNQRSFTVVYEMTELLGKWSMVDVFVVAILAALIHLGGLMEVVPGPAAVYFCAMVIISMLATHTFDPRQLWDIRQQNTDNVAN